MVVYENNCVGCDRPCIDCGRRHQRVIVCDECDEYADYYTPWGDLCEDCLMKVLREEIEPFDPDFDSRDIDELCDLAEVEVSKI